MCTVFANCQNRFSWETCDWFFIDLLKWPVCVCSVHMLCLVTGSEEELNPVLMALKRSADRKKPSKSLEDIPSATSSEHKACVCLPWPLVWLKCVHAGLPYSLAKSWLCFCFSISCMEVLLWNQTLFSYRLIFSSWCYFWNKAGLWSRHLPGAHCVDQWLTVSWIVFQLWKYWQLPKTVMSNYCHCLLVAGLGRISRQWKHEKLSLVMVRLCILAVNISNSF